MESFHGLPRANPSWDLVSSPASRLLCPRGCIGANQPYKSGWRGEPPSITKSTMKLLLLPCLLLATLSQLLAEIRRDGKDWILENPQLKVTIAEETARVTVRDKASGTTWTQLDPN